MGDLDSAELAERLRRALEPQQVISALRDLGISTEDFELVTGADQRTVRRWADGSEPRSQAADAIDRLRVAVLYLLQRNAMAPQEIPHWLRRRNLELDLDADLGVRRPLDAIRDDQLPDVLAAVNAFLHPLDSDSSERIAEQLRKTAVAAAARATERAHAVAAANREKERVETDAVGDGESTPVPAGRQAGRQAAEDESAGVTQTPGRRGQLV